MLHKLSFYKTAAELLKLVKDSGRNVKSILYSERKYKFMNIKALYALVTEALKHWAVLEILVEKSKVLTKEPNFNVWHVRILLTELFFGRKELNSEHEFVLAFLNYEKKFRKILLKEEVQNLLLNLPKSKVVGVKVRYIKVNTIQSDVESVISAFKEEGWQQLLPGDSYQDYLSQLGSLEPCSQLFLQDFHIPEVLAFPPGTELYEHELYKNGSFYFMDKSSCLAPYLLQPEPQSLVLDMCAAPGLKTIHLAGLVPSGKVFAVERNAERFKVLQEMVSCSGAENVVAVPGDVTHVDLDKYKHVEYVLLDPSCSGSGMRDRQPREDHDGQDKDRLYRLQSFQLTLLRFALTRFPAAKRVVYSTCSLNLEENEEVVLLALNSKYHNFEVVSVEEKLPGWTSFGSDRFNFGPKCLYSLPESDFTNGFFVAVFERKVPRNRSKNNSEILSIHENGVGNELQSNSLRKNKKLNPNNEFGENSSLNKTKLSRKRPRSENNNDYTKKKFKEDANFQYELQHEGNFSIKSKNPTSDQHKETKKTNKAHENTKTLSKKQSLSQKKRMRKRKIKSLHLHKPTLQEIKKKVSKDSLKTVKKQNDNNSSDKNIKLKDQTKTRISKAKLRHIRLKKLKLASKSVNSKRKIQEKPLKAESKEKGESNILISDETSNIKLKKRKKSSSTEVDISQSNTLTIQTLKLHDKKRKKSQVISDISSADVNQDDSVTVHNRTLKDDSEVSRKKLKKKLREEDTHENVSNTQILANPSLSDIVQTPPDESVGYKKKKSKVNKDNSIEVSRSSFKEGKKKKKENTNDDSKVFQEN